MSKDPTQCCHVANGKRCPNKPIYKIGARGFCERHKPTRETAKNLWKGRTPMHGFDPA